MLLQQRYPGIRVFRKSQNYRDIVWYYGLFYWCIIHIKRPLWCLRLNTGLLVVQVEVHMFYQGWESLPQNFLSYLCLIIDIDCVGLNLFYLFLVLIPVCAIQFSQHVIYTVHIHTVYKVTQMAATLSEYTCTHMHESSTTWHCVYWLHIDNVYTY